MFFLFSLRFSGGFVGEMTHVPSLVLWAPQQMPFPSEKRSSICSRTWYWVRQWMVGDKRGSWMKPLKWPGWRRCRRWWRPSLQRRSRPASCLLRPVYANAHVEIKTSGTKCLTGLLFIPVILVSSYVEWTQSWKNLRWHIFAPFCIEFPPILFFRVIVWWLTALCLWASDQRRHCVELGPPSHAQRVFPSSPSFGALMELPDVHLRIFGGGIVKGTLWPTWRRQQRKEVCTGTLEKTPRRDLGEDGKMAPAQTWRSSPPWSVFPTELMSLMMGWELAAGTWCVAKFLIWPVWHLGGRNGKWIQWSLTISRFTFHSLNISQILYIFI